MGITDSVSRTEALELLHADYLVDLESSKKILEIRKTALAKTPKHDPVYPNLEEDVVAQQAFIEGLPLRHLEAKVKIERDFLAIESSKASLGSKLQGYRYLSTKTFKVGSVAFRQWRAKSHCSFVHGYHLSFKVWFAAKTLDDKNWVADFGSFKDNGIKSFLAETFDHKTCVAGDDPLLEWFKNGESAFGLVLRVFEGGVGCEKFAEFVFKQIGGRVLIDSLNRVRVVKVECFEDGTDNSAIYEEQSL